MILMRHNAIIWFVETRNERITEVIQTTTTKAPTTITKTAAAVFILHREEDREKEERRDRMRIQYTMSELPFDIHSVYEIYTKFFYMV